MNASTDRIERKILLKAPRSRVWRALSNAEEFGNWFGVALKGKAFVAGQRVQGHITYPGYEHLRVRCAGRAHGAGALAVLALASGGHRSGGRLFEGADHAGRLRAGRRSRAAPC